MCNISIKLLAVISELLIRFCECFIMEETSGAESRNNKVHFLTAFIYPSTLT